MCPVEISMLVNAGSSLLKLFVILITSGQKYILLIIFSLYHNKNIIYQEEVLDRVEGE